MDPFALQQSVNAIAPVSPGILSVMLPLLNPDNAVSTQT